MNSPPRPQRTVIPVNVEPEDRTHGRRAGNTMTSQAFVEKTPLLRVPTRPQRLPVFSSDVGRQVEVPQLDLGPAESSRTSSATLGRVNPDGLEEAIFGTSESEAGGGSDLSSRFKLDELGPDSAISLPQAVAEVVNRHKDQTHEIMKQKHVLAKIKAELKEEDDTLEGLVEEYSAVKAKTKLALEQVNIQRILANNLRKETESLIQEKVQIDSELGALVEQKEKDDLTFAEYLGKISAFEELVEKEERASSRQVMIKEQQHTNDELQARKEAFGNDPNSLAQLLEGLGETALEGEIQALQGEVSSTDDETETLREEVKKEKGLHSHIKRETEILRKRNAAQLARLRSQLKETQIRTRHWREQARSLEQSILHLQVQLSKC